MKLQKKYKIYKPFLFALHCPWQTLSCYFEKALFFSFTFGFLLLVILTYLLISYPLFLLLLLLFFFFSFSSSYSSSPAVATTYNTSCMIGAS